MLLKISFMQELLASHGSAVMLLYDFMADFDPQLAEILVNLLKDLKSQLIVTSPSYTGHFDQQLLLAQGAHHITLQAE